VSTGGDLSAHGLGGVQDLPISLNLAIGGAVAALLVSFTVLALAWRRPRYDARRGGVPVPGVQRVVEHRAFTIGLRVFGMVVFLYTVFVSVFGVDKVLNPFFGIFYVWLWVGIVPMSLLFGPFWKAISPVRTINLLFARLAGTDPDEGVRAYPSRLGYWPAALGLYAFVWLELVYPHMSELSPVRLWCAIYVAVMLLGGAVWGNGFYERGDPFEVYSTLVGRLSVWGYRDDGTLVVRSPLANLDGVVVAPGLVGVVGVLFGSTGFDSFGESPTWVRYLQGSSINGYLLNNVALAVFCLGAILLFSVACMLTGVADPPDARDERDEADETDETDDVRPRRTPRWLAARGGLPNAFAHSIVPIVVGYIVAHYLTYFLEVGSNTVALASDPLSNGSNILGTADFPRIAWLSYHPTLLANLKVGAVVVGHVVAAIASHDRALKLLPRRHQLLGQLPLLVVMVGFTGGGLLLLFSS
jgi:hypothetical protein